MTVCYPLLWSKLAKRADIADPVPHGNDVCL
jgi:hypothetical protein